MSIINKYIQADKKTDDELFAWVGQYLTSKKVIAELGGPVTSEPGNVWHIAHTGGVLIGFALTAFSIDGASAHIKQLYGDQSPFKTRNLMLTEILEMVTEAKCERVFTFARENDELWEKRGFSFKKHARGVFGTWEKVISQ